MPFLYPLKPSPLMLIIISSFSIWLIFFNIVMFLLNVFVFAVFIPVLVKYLFTVLQQSANGHTKPPQLLFKLFQPSSDLRSYKLIFICATIYYIESWLSEHNHIISTQLTTGYFIFMMPAIIGLLTMSNSLIIAINPLAQLKFIQLIGFDYAKVLVTLIVTTILIAKVFNSDTFLSIFFSLYTGVLVFHWLGKLIYFNKDEFDLYPDICPERESKQKENELLALRESCLYAASREYQAERGSQIILKYVENEEEPLIAHRWFYEELLHSNKVSLAQHHGAVYIDRLLVNGKTAMADLVKEQLNELASKHLK